jgi:hypothetical protein
LHHWPDELYKFAGNSKYTVAEARNANSGKLFTPKYRRENRQEYSKILYTSPVQVRLKLGKSEISTPKFCQTRKIVHERSVPETQKFGRLSVSRSHFIKKSVTGRAPIQSAPTKFSAIRIGTCRSNEYRHRSKVDPIEYTDELFGDPIRDLSIQRVPTKVLGEQNL